MKQDGETKILSHFSVKKWEDVGKQRMPDQRWRLVYSIQHRILFSETFYSSSLTHI
jgi:hypothetical protein